MRPSNNLENKTFSDLVDMVSENRFSCKDIKISGFTLTNINSTNTFTWADIVSTNRFTSRYITSSNRFYWMNIDSTNRIALKTLLTLIVLLGQTSPTLTGFLEQILLPYTMEL